MRILFLNNFFYVRGGSERVLFEEMRILKEAGHEVAVYTRRFRLNEPSGFEKHFPPEIERERFTNSINGLKTLREILYSSSARRGLDAVIREFQPDIAHIHNIHGGLSTSVLDKLRSLKIPAVMTLHDLKLICPSYLMLNHGQVCESCEGKRFYKAFFNKCHKNSYAASAISAVEGFLNHTLKKYRAISKFIAPSNFLREKHIEYGFDPKKIIYLPNFVDLGGMRERSAVGDYLLYFGRLSVEKGVSTMIKAHARLRKPVELKIVGVGGDAEELKKSIAPRQRVSFLGYLTGAELGRVLENARAVIIPSECYENAPLTILESFAHYKPVIGSNMGGIPELINHAEDGLIFESGNVKDLADKMNYVAALTSLELQQMGRVGRQKVELNYNVERHCESLVSLYNGLLH